MMSRTSESANQSKVLISPRDSERDRDGARSSSQIANEGTQGTEWTLFSEPLWARLYRVPGSLRCENSTAVASREAGAL